MMPPTTAIPAKVLVVGAHGFLATHLLSRLRASGASRLVAIGRRAQAPVGASCYHSLDFTSSTAPETLRGILASESPEWIFHLVGGPRSTATDSVVVNTLPAAILLDSAAATAPQASIVIVGSAAEYGVPTSPSTPIAESHPCTPINLYGATKLAQTHLALYAARSGLCVSIARPFNLVGPGLSPAFLPGAVLIRALDAIARGIREIEVGYVDSQRDFVAVEDTVDALIRLAAARATGEIFNICSGHPTSIRQVVETLLAGFSPPLGYRINPGLGRAGDPSCVIGSAAKLHSCTGWIPQTPLAESLAAAVRYSASRAP